MSDTITTVSHKENLVRICRDRPAVIIGERINPTGRKKMQAAILEDDFEMVRQDAISQVAAGAAKIVERAAQHGIATEDIVIDPLVMSVGADSNAGRTALETTRLITEELGVNMTMGASNISFGLPDRKGINAAFITMAIHAGITCPITNPLVPEITTSILAADLAMGRDGYAMRGIKAYRRRSSAN